MYQYILEIMTTFPQESKIIVTQYEEIEYCASQYGFEAIMNREPELGISHSIQLGLKAVLERKPNLEGVMFGVCDQPYLRRTSIDRLLQAFSVTDRNIVALAWQETIGNPCIFGKKYFEELFSLSLDTGGKKILLRHPEDVEFVMVQEAKELIDIDTRTTNDNE
ncbi:MAG: nucleotidyltransferase family protein [Firmicutes bacterium]|nr:nucleotidyltransferase family protein [Bacillota bacterium]